MKKTIVVALITSVLMAGSVLAVLKWLNGTSLFGVEGAYIVGKPGYFNLVNAKGEPLPGVLLFREFKENCDWPLPVKTITAKWGFMARDGSLLFPEKYDNAGCFVNEYAPVTLRGLREFVRKDGSEKIREGLLKFYHSSTSVGGLAFGLVPVVSCDGGQRGGCKWGYVDQFGKNFLNPQFLIASNFAEGLANVTSMETVRTGYIDTTGNLVIPMVYWGAGDFNEGLAYVNLSRNGPFGYIDRVGRMQISPKYKKAESFFEGMAAVTDGIKWGYINQKGELLIPMQFNEAGRFRDRLARVRDSVGYAHIDKAGRVVFRD